jgi:putative transposase
MNCKYCASEEVIRHGFNQYKDYKVQKYKCDCGHIFSHPDKLPRYETSSEVISLCMDVYIKGLSYRVMAQQIYEQFKLRISHTSIYGWMQGFAEMLTEYMRQQRPNLGAHWQIDETMISFKGTRIGTKSVDRKYWLWLCIDKKTRFIVHAKLTMDRASDKSDAFFSEMVSFNYDLPGVIATDGLQNYKACIKKYFPQAVHVNLKHISVKPDTSFIERLNGTFKNRTKTMRGFQEFDACQKTLNMIVIHYNFLRPHTSLDGKTPAEEAGIGLNLQGRWIDLIRRAQLNKL